MRSKTWIVAINLLMALNATAWERPEAAAAEPPDVLLIITDQFNPRCAGFAGDPNVKTPHLDKLAANGAAFEACYSNCPVCMPARVSLVSGQYPHEHGWWMNGGGTFPPEKITLFRDLQQVGYTTAQVGKFHYSNHAGLKDYRDATDYHRAIGLDWGDELPTPFSTHSRTSPYSDYLIQRGLLDVFLDDIYARFTTDQYLVKPGPLPPDDHIDSFVARRAIQFVERHPLEKPMFLFVSFPGPHTPLDACGKYATMYDPAAIELPPNVQTSKRCPDKQALQAMRGLYYGKISMLDKLIGDLLAALERRGTFKRTLVLFTSDHGEMMGAHGKLSKGVFYEESGRIPLLACWPGRIKAGLRTDALVELIDVYATIADAAGAKMASTSHGRSFLPVATGCVEAHREVVFGEIGPRDRLDFMVRTPTHKYMQRGKREYLFDMRQDPWEMKDLARSTDPAVQNVLADMRKKLADFVPEKPLNLTAGYVSQFGRMQGGKTKEQLLEEMAKQRQAAEVKLRKASRRREQPASPKADNSLAGTAAPPSGDASPASRPDSYQDAGRSRAPFTVLFSNDATNITSCRSPFNTRPGPFRREHIIAAVDETAGCGIDVHLLQPGLGWVPWWQSEVYPMTEHARFVKSNGSKLSSWDKFVLKGGDLVKLFAERCRQRGLSPFVSLRLNDAHHIFRHDEIADAKQRTRAMAVCRFYHEHPEYRMGPGTRDYDWYQYMLDWRHEPVRQYKLALIEELCRNYDLDGFELDFMRHCKFFRNDQTPVHRRAQILTEFVAQVRRILDETTPAGSHRWLCVRVPPYVDVMAEIGIDLQAFAEAGVDMVNASPHYFTVMTSDVAELRQLLPDHVRLYHELHFASAVGPPLTIDGQSVRTLRRTTPRQYYTAAHLTYARGGDGISTFNFHYYRGARDVYGPPQEPPFEIFTHLADRDWLARQPQHYLIGRTTHRVLAKSAHHAGRNLGKNVSPRRPVVCQLDMAPPQGGWTTAARLRIQAHSSLADTQWQARFNGVELAATDDVSEPCSNPYPIAQGEPADYRAWTVPVSLLRDGDNRLELTMTKGKPVRLCFIDLAVQ